MTSEDPQWKVLFSRSALLFKEKRVDESLRYVSKAIQLGADRANVFDLRADIYEQKRQFKKALGDSKSVIKLAPESPQGYLRSARLFYKMTHLDHSMVMAKHSLERLSPSNPRHTELRAEIDSLIGMITHDIEEKRKLVSRQTCHVANLPFELLVMAFELAMEADSALPVIASHVCRHWRQVALNHTPLWRTLVLSNRKPEKKAEYWDSRSNYMVESVIFKPLLTKTSFERVLTRLLPTFQKWPLRSFHVADFLNPFPQLEMISSSLGDGFDPLEIKLSGMNAKAQSDYSPINTWIPTSSRRYLLHLDDMRIKQIPCLSNSMRSFVLSNIWVPHTVNHGSIILALAEASHLENLVLDIHSRGSWPLKPPPTVILPYLRHLQVSGSRICADILPFLGLPALKVLHIFSVAGTNLRLHLINLNQSTGLPPPNLHELRIRACPLADGDLIKVLETCGRNLEILEASSMNCGIDGVLQAMAGLRKTPEGTAGALCPLVTELVLNHSENLGSAAIKDFVKSRDLFNDSTLGIAENNSQPTAIERLSIDGCPKVEPALLPWLRGKVRHLSCIYESAASIRKSRKSTGPTMSHIQIRR